MNYENPYTKSKPYFTGNRRFKATKDLLKNQKNLKMEKVIINKSKLDEEGWYNIKTPLLTEQVENDLYYIKNRDILGDGSAKQVKDLKVFHLGKYIN
ncbi:hypothetical protein CWI37_1647p0010 [Hamiltosporidium tvaerminnensis]|uniref:Uncharacterized protein n=2 Tax=Hamiltosporidium TaxID=1176354 RepID=A0A4Q9L198_9MICR|nr:hypothetical protein LUQ84_001540 [Hamiltosporidium tvaerminnensis]TBT98676.1 hypothetical protein CWI37_1647p0010 [Hamiltosporidium tvaerminnensis]TBU01128.1 hypothetical protein CWI39_1476p0010 [Hamiltosporidium magnivora]